METILKDILKEMKDQTKELRQQTILIENLFKKDSLHKDMKKGVNNMIKTIANMPGMDSPQAKDLLKGLANIIPGG